jgi:hypothetical protein
MRIGDVYRVDLGGAEVGYFQYIGDDSTQLHANVIRVFSGRYNKDVPPEDLAVLAQADVAFHCHVVLSLGKKLGAWLQIGWTPVVAGPPVVFRASRDFGDPKVKVSRDWYVWTVGSPTKLVGSLPEEFRAAEIGVVKPPNEVIERMRTGKYAYFYPAFE